MNLENGNKVHGAEGETPHSSGARSAEIVTIGSPATATGMNEILAPGIVPPRLCSKQIELLLNQISLSPERADLIAAIVPDKTPPDIVVELIRQRFQRVEVIEVIPKWESLDAFDLAVSCTDNFTKPLDVICIVGLESVLNSTDPDVKESGPIALNCTRDRFKRNAKCPIVYVVTEELAIRCHGLCPDLWSRIAERYLSGDDVSSK